MLAAVLAAFLTCSALTAAAPAADGDPPTTLAEDAATFTLANGRVRAVVNKRSGSFSLKYGALDVIDRGYWSQVGRSAAGDIAAFGPGRVSAVRLDPAANAGERAEVVCKFAYAPGAPGLPCDVEMHYALGRGDRGLYARAVWEHKPGYPPFSVGEARMALKLNPAVFDFLAIDAKRRLQLPAGADWAKGEPLNLKEARRMTTGPFAGRVEHKYDYSAVLPDTPAYGWTSTRRHVGVWLINPSFEYLAGGPTKVELTGHLDVNPGGAPTLLNMWHGSHYGGSSLAVGPQEAWVKVIGPFLLYCNASDAAESADAQDRMWKDALSRAAAEQKAWPYAWAADANYPPAEQRGTVGGKLVLADPPPGAAPRPFHNLRVGLASPPYSAGAEGPGGGAAVDWQRDSKYYQFWTRADEAGNFTIRNVRPGSYTLYAFADGVLGEFSAADVTVLPGRAKNLGPLTWLPARFGRQLWEIGVPDRTAAEFRHGDDYWHWGLYYDYAREFPGGVNFVIGRSDWRKDWNYCQPPRIEGNRAGPSVWSITFDLPAAPRGRATLRLAVAGSRLPGGIEVSVNGKPAGTTTRLPDTGVMHRDGIRGYWCERDVPFDAALLQAGPNVLRLKPPATTWVNGVLYDYLRLELDEAATPADTK